MDFIDWLKKNKPDAVSFAARKKLAE